MKNLALAEVIANPVESFSSLSDHVDSLAELQGQIKELEEHARVLRAQVREGMTVAGLDRFTSAGGHRASLFSTTKWQGDRAKAERLLNPALVAEIFQATTTTTLRVK